jgi:hypothetical protein
LSTATTRHPILDIWASAWSEPDSAKRRELLAQAAQPNCAYIDPHTNIVGHASISEYMQGFQASAPGARFVNKSFKTHHDRCVLEWDMVDREGNVLSSGISAGMFSAQGRLLQMIGFF